MARRDTAAHLSRLVAVEGAGLRSTEALRLKWPKEAVRLLVRILGLEGTAAAGAAAVPHRQLLEGSILRSCSSCRGSGHVTATRIVTIQVDVRGKTQVLLMGKVVMLMLLLVMMMIVVVEVEVAAWAVARCCLI